MSEAKRTIDPAALLREVAGLDYPPELVAAWVDGDKAMREMAQTLPRDLPYAVEPAHVFTARAKD